MTEYFNLIPFFGGAVGNVATFAGSGAEARLGWNIPRNFGPETIAPTYLKRDRSWSLYMFYGMEGRFILRNIFLDGNTFVDNGGVNKEPFVYDSYWGFYLRSGGIGVKYTLLTRSEEFEEQPKPESFGSLSVTFDF